jgi:prolipoprotein diacylglyceryltransferase
VTLAELLHYLFEFGAYTVGAQLFLWRRRRYPDAYSSNDRLYVTIHAVAGALVGSRLLGILEHPSWFGQQPWLTILGQKTILGGIIGATAASEWAKLRRGFTASSGDALVVPLLVAMMIGRVGCHLGGLEDGTYGIATSLPWGVDFGDGILRHPTNLYEIAFLAILLIWSFVSPPPSSRNGALYRRFFSCYMVWRMGIEGLKPIEPLFFVGVFPVGSIQAAAFVALVAWNVYIRRRFASQ